MRMKMIFLKEKGTQIGGALFDYLCYLIDGNDDTLTDASDNKLIS